MANKKFSEFTVKTDPANVDFLVGYDGTDNVRIDPSNLGGGGASDLNGLSDVSVDLTNDNAFFINIPSGISGATGNLVIGEGAGNSIVGSSRNTVIGFNAFKDSSDSGREDNTVIGHSAGENLTNQFTDSVVIGSQAMTNATNGVNTVAVGFEAMNTGSGFYTTAVGMKAARQATGGAITALGFEAARYATGNHLVALGGSYLTGGAARDVTAQYCVAVGAGALQDATSEGCIGIGYKAGRVHTSGVGSTYIGFESGATNTVAGYRTMVGWKSGNAHTGSFSTAIGYSAMSSGTGTSNVAVGSNALTQCDASRNVAIGHQAMFYSLYSDDCVVIGSSAMNGANAGDKNVAIGSNSLQVSQGNQNVCVGHNSGKRMTSGGNNVAIGYNVSNDLLWGLTSGSNNILIGNNANSSSATVNNEITFGNSSITALRCAVTSITSLSDERDKSEIKDLEYGLAFIDALQPREFVWDNRPETRIETDEEGNETEVEFYSDNKGKKDFGFIAQEVRELDNDTLRLVYTENEDKLELSYGKLVPILVKAIQELKEEVELLKS
jgi:hypothetical protein